MEAEYIRRHHRHEPRENQCTSALVRHIKAPVHLVSLSLSSSLSELYIELRIMVLSILGGVDLFDFLLKIGFSWWVLTFFWFWRSGKLGTMGIFGGSFLCFFWVLLFGSVGSDMR